jgi:hypothetical protein
MANIDTKFIAFCASLTGAIILLNPMLMMDSLTLAVSPSILFNAEPWYRPLPLLGLILLAVSYGMYTRSNIIFRRIIWTLSFLYWAGWFIFFLNDYDPFAKYWIIWGPHLAAAVISIFGFCLTQKPNQALKKDADNKSSAS